MASDTLTPVLPTTRLRVRFHELDPYGHVNHGVYLNYFETARIEALAHLGIGLEVLRERGLHLVVVEVRVRFRAPAVAGDLLTIATHLRQLRPASSWWHQSIVAENGTLVAEAEARSATCDAAGRPMATPADLLAIVAPYVTLPT